MSGAGDVNNDGIEDLLIGADYGDTDGLYNNGSAYVVFGRDDATNSFPSTIDLASLDGTDGFVMTHPSSGALLGRVGRAGDVNGDGIDDLIVGAWPRGETFVVFGKDTDTDGNFAALLDVTTLDGTNGFMLDGNSTSGNIVAGIGDINGDGIDDIATGAPAASGGGQVHVIFGKNTAIEGGFSASIDLNSLDGTDGFVISGPISGDRLNIPAAAGDINGDGIDDFMVNADWQGNNGNGAGRSYVVFGKDTATEGGFGASLDLTTLDGTNGFEIMGSDAGDVTGLRMSSVGDVNGDGVDDIVVSADGADPGGKANAGEVYLIFGRNTAAVGDFAASFDLSTFSSSDGFVFRGIDPGDQAGRSGISGGGDINADGAVDLVITALNANGGTGESYVIYGGEENLTAFDAADGLADGRIDLSFMDPDALIA